MTGYLFSAVFTDGDFLLFSIFRYSLNYQRCRANPKMKWTSTPIVKWTMPRYAIERCFDVITSKAIRPLSLIASASLSRRASSTRFKHRTETETTFDQQQGKRAMFRADQLDVLSFRICWRRSTKKSILIYPGASDWIVPMLRWWWTTLNCRPTKMKHWPITTSNEKCSCKSHEPTSTAAKYLSVCSYRQAQATVLEALPRLKAEKIATKRPEDYYAQMVKTDEHMKKVKHRFTWQS